MFHTQAISKDDSVDQLNASDNPRTANTEPEKDPKLTQVKNAQKTGNMTLASSFIESQRELNKR